MIDYFGGFTRHDMKCRKCHKTSFSFAPISDLSVPLVTDGNSAPGNLRRGVSAPRLLLPDLIASFLRPIEIDQSNGFQCPFCRYTGGAESRQAVVKWPRILAIHLVRFHENGSKNAAPVEYPYKLCIGNIVAATAAENEAEVEVHPQCKRGEYELTGVVLHHGTAGSGHYTALVRSNVSAASWFSCDDSSVTAVSEADVFQYYSKVYVLFYSMRIE